jgi:hypothetical protein
MLTQAKSGLAVWINVSILVMPANAKGVALTIHLFRDVTASKDLLALVQEHLTPPPDLVNDSPGVLTSRELELLGLISLGLDTEAAACTTAQSGGQILAADPELAALVDSTIGVDMPRAPTEEQHDGGSGAPEDRAQPADRRAHGWRLEDHGRDKLLGDPQRVRPRRGAGHAGRRCQAEGFRSASWSA